MEQYSNKLIEYQPFDEVLEYYNRMNFKTGEKKLYQNLDSNSTKEIALKEIERRSKIYRIEHNIEEKIGCPQNDF